MRVLGVFVCWRALVRVTSQTAAPTTAAAAAAAASTKLFRGACVLFPKEKTVIFYFFAVIGRTFLKLANKSGDFRATRV